MTLEGVIGIVEGLNPTLIRMKLDSYNDNKSKAAKPAPEPANRACQARRRLTATP